MRRKLGEGVFSTVYEAFNIKADISCAIKVISKTKLREHKVHEELMIQELEILDKLENPHIVHVFDICEDVNNIYIVMELMTHGTLMQKLSTIKENQASLNEQDAAKIVYQILIALNFLHKQNVIHRNLKLENIMVDLERIDEEQTSLICKVTDFGYAKALEKDQKETLSFGVPIYMAPELV